MFYGVDFVELVYRTVVVSGSSSSLNVNHSKLIINFEKHAIVRTSDGSQSV